MATTTIVPATQTVDDEQFINKLYDSNLGTQKQTLQDNYAQNTGALDSEKQSVQQQTDTNLTRTAVEAEKAANAYYKQPDAPMLSGGANAQAALAQGNQQQQNVTTLKGMQSDADAEIERERALLASEYESAIKKAQADNDMQRAQQLYEAAKLEEERLTEYKKTAGNLLAAKGDYSILQSLYGLTDDQVRALGGTPAAAVSDTGTATTTTATGEYATPDALKDDEEYLRKIYDASLESQRQELQTEYDRNLSDLLAEQEAARKETDKNLTQTYVDALKNAKNYAEVQRAYGMGSGTFGQARLAQDLELQKDLTALRGVQMGADAQTGRQASGLLKQYLSGFEQAQTESDRKWAEDLYGAAQDEEEKQIALQLEAGNLMASKNDYSILGALYGLTQDQIDRLQGTGKYAPVVSSGGGSGSGSSGGSSGYYKNWSKTKLMDMANAGIANYESKGNSPTGAASNKPTVVRGSTSSSKKVM